MYFTLKSAIHFKVSSKKKPSRYRLRSSSGKVVCICPHHSQGGAAHRADFQNKISCVAPILMPSLASSEVFLYVHRFAH